MRAIIPVPITARVPSKGFGEIDSAANAAEAAVRVALINDASDRPVDNLSRHRSG